MRPITTLVITSSNSSRTFPLRREAGLTTLRLLPIRLEARDRRDYKQKTGSPILGARFFVTIFKLYPLLIVIKKYESLI